MTDQPSKKNLGDAEMELADNLRKKLKNMDKK